MGRTSTAKEDLVDAAAELLWSNSYGSIGVDAVCREAGVRKGSFYHFFPSKDDLVLAAIDARWTETRERLHQFVHAQGPAAERLRTFFDAQAQRFAEVKTSRGHVPGCPFGNLGGELGAINTRVRERVEAVFDGFQQHFTALARQAAAEAELHPEEAQLAAVGQQLLALLQGGLLVAKTRDNPDVLSQLAPAAVTLLRTGVEG